MNKFTPILGTVIKGPFKDFKFIINSTREMRENFSVSCVYNSVKGKKEKHKNCIFKRSTPAEVKLYKDNKLTEEILNTLNTKFVPILVIPIKGIYKDNKFILKTNKEIKEYFEANQVYKVLRGEIEIHRGCTFKRCIKEEIELYKNNKITKEVIESLKERIDPILGTIIKGPHKDFKFILTSLAEINEHFNISSIYRVLNGQLKTHKGCTFELCDREKAKPHTNKISIDILQTILD